MHIETKPEYFILRCPSFPPDVLYKVEDNKMYWWYNDIRRWMNSDLKSIDNAKALNGFKPISKSEAFLMLL